MSKVSDIQQICILMLWPGDKVLLLNLIRNIYYIYIYSDKLLCISITIGLQSQQANVNTDSFNSSPCSLWYWKSNFLAWKSNFPTSSSSKQYYSIARSSDSISPDKC